MLITAHLFTKHVIAIVSSRKPIQRQYPICFTMCSARIKEDLVVMAGITVLFVGFTI